MADTNPSGSNIFTDLSQIIGKASEGAASGRAQEGQYLNARDAIMAHLYQIAQDARTKAAAQNLNNAKFTTSLPGVGASEAVRGSLIQNVQDVGVDTGKNHANVVNFTGGTRPSVLTPAARATGGDLIAHGQQLIAKPESFLPKTPGAGTDGTDVMPTPQQSAQPTAGFWGNVGPGAAVGTGILGALMKALGGGAGGPQSGGDLSKLLAQIKDKLTHKGGHQNDSLYGPDYGWSPDVPDHSNDSLYGPDYGWTPNTDNGTPNVDTSYDFSNDPNFAQYYNQQDGHDPNDWDFLQQYLNPTGGGGEQSGTFWGDE